MSDEQFLLDLLSAGEDDEEEWTDDRYETLVDYFSDGDSEIYYGIIPTEEPTADDEYNRIIDEFGLSSVLNESAMYRVWRMKQNDTWINVTDASTGTKMFGTWEEFITSISDVTGRGRQTIFNRVKTYSQLQLLGYTDEEMIGMMTKAPFIYQRALSYLMDFDVRTGEVRGLHYTDLGYEENEDLVLSEMKEIIDSLSSFERGKEALQYIETDILMHPAVSVKLSEKEIIVYWTIFQKDQNGVVIPTVDHAVFEAGYSVPDWVMEKVSGMLR